MIPRVADRRLVTYGTSPSGRRAGHEHPLRASRAPASMSSSSERATSGQKALHQILRFRLLGEHNVLNSLAACCHRLGTGYRRRGAAPGARRIRRRQASVHQNRRGRRRSRSSTITATTRSRSRRCSRRRARPRDGHVIAVIQPHRYTRLRDLFEDFCTSFNEADCGRGRRRLSRRRGADSPGIDRRTLWSRASARHGHRNVQRLRRARPDLPRRSSPISPKPGDSWSASAPAPSPTGRRPCRRSCRRSRRSRGWRRTTASDATSSTACRTVRGRLGPRMRRSAPIPGSGVGGPAEVLFRPADRDDLVAFLRPKPGRRAGDAVIGVGSNLLVRDGGVPGVVIRLGRRLRRDRGSGDETLGRRRRQRCAIAAIRRARPGWPGSNSCSAFPAPSAARCA